MTNAQESSVKRRDRRVLGLEDFTPEDIATIERAEPPVAASQFDNEIG